MYYKARDRAKNNGMNYHLCAILWRKRKPVEFRANISKSHPACKRVFPSGDESASMHAEMNVLRFAKPGDEIEVLRWGETDELRCSKPCPMCHAAMTKAGIRAVTYVNWAGEKMKMVLQ